jgi:arylsulfatase A-like enzyme
MNRRDFLCVAITGLKVLKTGFALGLGVFLLSLPTSALAAQDASGKKPNILMIIVDQQFAGAMSCAGNPYVKTPAMDAIAGRGVRFPNAYVNYPVCSPQRYSIFTGRLPCTRGLADANNKPVISLGNIARQAGYKTFFYGKWHIQDETFTRKDVKYSGIETNEDGFDPETVQNAKKLFSSYSNKEPFFACLSFYNPHDICEWARKASGYDRRTEMRNGEIRIDPSLADCPPLPANYAINADEAEAVQKRREYVKGKGDSAQKMVMQWDEKAWRKYLWAYYRLVELADKRIGEAMEALKKSGSFENTVIIFTSDHGEGMAAHRWHQKSCLYEESLRVPFIVAYPGKGRHGEVDDHLVSTGIDMIATVADLFGAPMPKGPYYGKSALPFVLDAASTAPTHDYVVSEAEVDMDGGYYGRSVRTKQYKYHVWSKGTNREQLFDLQKDPGETKNLAGDPAFAAVLVEHRKHVADWLARTDDNYLSADKGNKMDNGE